MNLQQGQEHLSKKIKRVPRQLSHSHLVSINREFIIQPQRQQGQAA